MNDTLKRPSEITPEGSEKAKNPSANGHRPPRVRVLVVDNDSTTVRLLEQRCPQADFLVSVVNNGLSAFELAQNKEFDVVLAELSLPRMTGLQLLTKLKMKENAPEIILMSNQADVGMAVEAMRLGADNFLSKPFTLSAVQEAVLRAYEKRKYNVNGNSAVRNLSRPRRLMLASLQSVRMKEVSQLVLKVAKSNSTILITGDSGVGKEVIAHTIHEESLRCNNSFTDISCAAIPETLLESELFGYEKGSFTGADSSKPGLFELANGGTLFLDEIGEIGPILQTKLLRVIETRSFYRVGGTKQITVDVRILAATNRDLKIAVEEGKFRKDLFYRLNTIHIEVPALKEHTEDIPSLVEQFIQDFDRTSQRRISDAAVEVLKQYPWPGNVRELRNVIERVLLISPQMLIDVEDLPKDISNYRPGLDKGLTEPNAPPISLIEMEKRQIVEVLQKTRWHRGKAAELLAISPKTLYRKIKQYDLDKPVRIY